MVLELATPETKSRPLPAACWVPLRGALWEGQVTNTTVVVVSGGKKVTPSLTLRV